MKIIYVEDWIAICNFALSIIGREPLVHLNDDTSDAAKVRAFLPQAIAVVSESFDWTFLRSSQELPQSTKTSKLYQYVYELPSDMALLTKVYTEPYEYRREGNLLLTDSDKCFIEFNFLPQDPLSLPMTFRNAISYYLAYLLAQPLSGDTNKQNNALNLFSTIIQQAEINDRRDLPKEGNPLWEESNP